jgi:hypothetical protein
MTPLQDMMKFRNLDRECLNLLAYRWLQAGPPGRLTVDQIAACFADIPKGHVHQTLAAVEKKGLILIEQTSKSVALTEKGFDYIQNAVAEPICACRLERIFFQQGDSRHPD